MPPVSVQMVAGRGRNRWPKAASRREQDWNHRTFFPATSSMETTWVLKRERRRREWHRSRGKWWPESTATTGQRLRHRRDLQLPFWRLCRPPTTATPPGSERGRRDDPNAASPVAGNGETRRHAPPVSPARHCVRLELR